MTVGVVLTSSAKDDSGVQHVSCACENAFFYEPPYS